MSSSTVERRLKQSSQDFLTYVWPQFEPMFGSVIPVESVSENVFADELDRRAGVDVWLLSTDGHMRGLASRVQRQYKCHETFTVRVRSPYGRPTELHKRRAEIAANRDGAGVISPHYFVQGFIHQDEPRLLGAAIARMCDVIAAVEADNGEELRPNKDGSIGYAVKWDAIEDAGCPIRRWPDRRPK